MTQGGRAGWLRYALYASLALNLFVVGFFGAHWLGLSWHAPPHGGPETVLDRLSAHLPDKDKAVLRDGWQADRNKLAGLFTDLQNARRVVRTKLTADPFEREALAAAVADARAKRQAYEQELQAVILEAVPKFSAEGRSRLWAGAGQH